MTRTVPARRAVTSSAQDRIWFADKLFPGSPGILCRVYRVTGWFDVTALRAAWEALVHRHGALRTILTEANGLPVQEITPDGATSVRFVDLTGMSDGEDRAERLSAEWAAEPFVLAEGPLARLGVMRLDACDHVLVLSLDQVISDDQSMSILVEELSEHYTAAIHDRLEPAGLPADYAAYARWQRDQQDTPEFHKLLDWWTARLTPPPPALSLPVDRARPLEPTVSGDSVRFDCGEKFATELAELTTTEGTTPFVVLLAAFQSLLWRYSRADRVAVEVPASVRPARFERVIGCFENPLVICTDFAGEPTFRELVARVTRTAQDALDHDELPFDRLVQALNADRDPRRIHLCDARFAFHDGPEPEPVFPGAVVRQHYAGGNSVRNDLALTMRRTGSTVEGTLAYRGDLFDRSSAHRILGQLRTMLSAALENPDLPAHLLPLDSAEQIKVAVRAADQIRAAARVERAVHDLIHLRAERQPDMPALSWQGRSISYRELCAQAALITDRLRGIDGVDGSAVAVRISAGPRQVAALLGVLDAGAYLVCLGAGDEGERGKAVLADQRPVCLVLDGESADDDLAEWYRSELNGPVLDVATLGTPDKPAAPCPSDLEKRVYVAYTSGTTGRPKGIAQNHRGFTQFVTWLAGEFEMRPGVRVAQWAAPGYDASLVEIFSTLIAGATLCPVPVKIRANPDKMADWLVAERIMFLQTVPSFARELLKVVTGRGVKAPRPALDHLLLAGESLAGDLANGLRAAWPSARLINLYGPTESILATWHEIVADVHGAVPIGKSIPGRQVLVLDDEDRPCPAGVTGHIVIRSPYMTLGYVGAENGNAPAFRPLRDAEEFEIKDAGCYRTGDLGRRRWDGALEFRGREDFQVKFYGSRVELTDIESTLAALDSVAECAVVGVAGPDGLVTRLVAYVVPQHARDAPVDVWRTKLRKHFGKSKLPVSFKTMDRLPRNVGGKVDRARLPIPAVRPPAPPRPPETVVEKGIAAIFSELLDIEQCSVDDTFFTAGGYSLLLPELLKRVRERFKVDVSLWEYLDNPALTALAAVVDSKTVAMTAATETMMG